MCLCDDPGQGEPLTTQCLNTFDYGGCQAPDLAGDGQSLLQLFEARSSGQVGEDRGDGGDLALDGRQLGDDVGGRGVAAGAGQGKTNGGEVGDWESRQGREAGGRGQTEL